MCSGLAPLNWLSPRTERQAHNNNHSAADDLDNIFDELRHFPDGDKDFDCDRIQRTSTPECKRQSPYQEETLASDLAAAFEELLQIDKKYHRKEHSKRYVSSSSPEDKVEGNVKASVQRFEDILAKTVSQSHRWRGEGYQRSEVRLTAETGHLVWKKPRGTLELVIGEGDKTKAFRCYLDPQNSGVKLSHLNNDGLLEMVLDGTESPRCSRSERRVTNQIGLKENYFRFESYEGHVRLLLDPLLDSKWDFFKMNYVIL
ncbi:uncharacterized protein LOC135468963 [Liolophura sinensis]|uniref:uncharacterized protein LOC135468963 n=1 Tax=Liolophura sinensis TaxID=3198878 RepID=UPI0031589C21